MYGSMRALSKRLPKCMPTAAMIHTMAVCDSAAEAPSSIACATLPRMATMNAAIIVLLWPGSSPWSAPSSMALGT